MTVHLAWDPPLSPQIIRVISSALCMSVNTFARPCPLVMQGIVTWEDRSQLEAHGYHSLSHFRRWNASSIALDPNRNASRDMKYLVGSRVGTQVAARSMRGSQPTAVACSESEDPHRQ